MSFVIKKKSKHRENSKYYFIIVAHYKGFKSSKNLNTAKKCNIPSSNLQRYLKQDGIVKDVFSKFTSNQIFTETKKK